MKRYRVGIPTTGGMCWVQSIERIDVLPASHVVAPGDFRHVFPSRDYATLAKTLLPKLGITGPFELAIAGEIESGRSWEFPVVLAHLLQQRGLLADPDEEPNEVIVATGAVGQDFNLVQGDYDLASKTSYLPNSIYMALSAPGSGQYGAFRRVDTISEALRTLGVATGDTDRVLSNDLRGVQSAANRHWWRMGLAATALVAAAAGLALTLLSRQPVDQLVGYNPIYRESLDQCLDWFRNDTPAEAGQQFCGWEIWRRSQETNVFLVASPDLTDQVYDISRQVLNQGPLLPLLPSNLKIGAQAPDRTRLKFTVGDRRSTGIVVAMELETAR